MTKAAASYLKMRKFFILGNVSIPKFMNFIEYKCTYKPRKTGY